MHRVLQRTGLPAFIIGTASMLALTMTALILAAGYHDQLGTLKQVIYTRCVQREAYDVASQQARAAQVQYLEDQIAAERTNKFIDDALRIARIASAQRAIDGLNRALTVGAPQGCNAYK